MGHLPTLCDPSSFRDLCSLQGQWLQGKLENGWLHQTLKVSIFEAHRVRMSPNRKNNGLLCGQALLDIDRQTIKIAKRWHSSHLTTGKGCLKLVFVSQM